VDGYGVVTVSKDIPGRITVSFPYDPQLVAKVKTIDTPKLEKDVRSVLDMNELCDQCRQVKR
jgi:hypothetical protein